MHKITIPLVFVLACLAAFAGTAIAADAAVPTDSSLLSVLDPIREAFAGGRYAYAGALALVLAVTLTKKFGGDRVPWFRGDAGGAALTMLGAFGASLAASLAPGGTVSPAMLWTAITIGVGAAGGYSVVKRLLIPSLVTFATAHPRLGVAVRPVLWVFDAIPA